MDANTKSSQLQIRVSAAEKTAIQRAARKTGMDMSTYVLGKVLPAPESGFQDLLRELGSTANPANALAAINDLLSRASGAELTRLFDVPPPTGLNVEHANYVAAMVELAAHQAGVSPPGWVNEIAPLTRPMFGSDLESLRLYLLTNSPPPFRRRNIFIDTSLGGRV